MIVTCFKKWCLCKILHSKLRRTGATCRWRDGWYALNPSSAKVGLSQNPGPYLEGQGNLLSRLVTGITTVTIWVIGVINLLTKSP